MLWVVCRDPIRRHAGSHNSERAGGGEISEAPDDRAENPRGQLAEQVLGARVQGAGGHISTGGADITCRTSIGMFNGFPSDPGADEARAAIS